MKLLYLNEHLTCFNYVNPYEAIFEKISLKKEETFELDLDEANILFVLKGNVNITDNNHKRAAKEDDIILFPPANHLTITSSEEANFVLFKINSPIHLCNIQPLESIFEETHIGEHSVSLSANKRIKDFFNLLFDCLSDGLRCKCFAEIKSKEIFYYFRAYYSKELLRSFFAPLLTKEYEFSVYVLRNYKKMKTVQQFAEASGYSSSIFEKKFKKIFHESAYQWMTKQKSKLIYNDLINTNRTLIDLADEYDFSSLSQFCDFCKRVLGSSPGKIRSQRQCKNTYTGFMNK